ncbi:MAG TPA: SgcJ/EcaC family oxidoreductase [Vicinamibacterales bacterium]|nr:SgcJ/EcaC family oxidoreductase [Vicinamibacterales bacterium]
MSDEQGTSVISKNRLEMLVDGIFAIAMTILVLELKVPELEHGRSVHELARALAQQLPTFGSYLLSFLVLGGFWYRQNHQFRFYLRITGPMLVLYLVQLAAVAAFPFCAALLGRYPRNGTSVAVYYGCLVVYLWAITTTWIVAKRSGSTGPELTEEQYRRSRRRSLRFAMVFTVLFAAFVGVAVTSRQAQPLALSRDEQAIRNFAATWQKALLDRDAAGQAAMFASDGVEYHDGQEPLVGPAAVLAWEQNAASHHPKAKITTTTDRIVIASSGDLAVQSGEGRITGLGANGEDTSVRRQRFVTVWRKVDGNWKVAHDIAVNITPYN